MSLFSRATKAIREGSKYMFGVDPVRRGSTHVDNVLGMRLTYNNPLDAAPSSIVPMESGLGRAMNIAGGLFTLGVTGALVLEGWSRDGFGGVTDNLGFELAVSTAIAQNTYRLASDGKVSYNKGMRRALAGFGVGAVGAAAGNAMGFDGPVGMAASMGGAYAGAWLGSKAPNAFGLAAAGAAGVGLAAYGGYSILKTGHAYRQQQRSIQTSGSLAAFHTRGAHTMRQRAVQAIAKSHLNARSALGSESNYFHYPSRSYHSRYRRTY